MKCVIVLNGDFTDNYDFSCADLIIACDGAYSGLTERGIAVDVVLGDFDSLGFVPQGAVVYPVEKDKTDGEIAIETAISSGAESIDIVCFGGGREDHFLGNLSLLIKAANMGVRTKAVTRYSEIRFLEKGVHVFSSERGKTVSLFTFGSCLITRSEGLKYPYNNTTLKNDGTLGLSNVTTGDRYSLKISEGSVFLLENF